MIRSLIRKWRFRKMINQYKNGSMDALVKKFSHSFYLSERSFSWELKSFNQPVRVFNINGRKESFKFPTHFVIKDRNVCYIFSGLKSGCDKYKKMSGEFDSFDSSFIRRFKEFAIVNSERLDEIMESDRDGYTVEECVDKFERLYLTAVCDLTKPRDIVYLDKPLYLLEMRDKIKKKLIENHVGEK